MTAHKTKARWDRLVAVLADHGITTTLAYEESNVVAFGRTRKSTDHVLRIRLDDRFIEVEDANVDGHWVGWRVTLSSEGVVVREWPPSRFPLTVAGDLRTAIACTVLEDVR